MSEEMQLLFQQLFDAWKTRDLEAVAALCAPNYEGIDVGAANSQQGTYDMQLALQRYLQAFPDLHFSGEVVAEENRVAWFGLARGTHQGKFMNIPPTQKTVEVRGTVLLTLENGKIKKGLFIWDTAGLLRAFGLLPELKI